MDGKFKRDFREAKTINSSSLQSIRFNGWSRDKTFTLSPYVSLYFINSLSLIYHFSTFILSFHRCIANNYYFSLSVSSWKFFKKKKKGNCNQSQILISHKRANSIYKELWKKKGGEGRIYGGIKMIQRKENSV